jgi:sn-glycerol 3-phosphate transport system substrate-binding protein
MTMTCPHVDRRTTRRHPLAVVLVAVSILMAACSGSGDGGDATPAGTAAPSSPPVDVAECPVDAMDQTEGPVTVTMWHPMSSRSGAVLNELVVEFNRAQDRVRVDAVYQGDYSDTFTKYVNTLRSGGDLPDVVMLNETSMQQMVDSESTVPIEACVSASGYDTSDFAGRLLDQYKVGDVLVTLPFQLSNPVLYFDGSDFVAAGLDPDDPPATFSEVLAASRALAATGVAEDPLALDVDSWIFEQWVNMAGTPLVDHDNGRTARAGEALLETGAAVEVFGFLATMRDEGLVRNTGRGTDQAGLAKFLAVGFGEASMTISSSANLGEIYDQLARFPGVDIRVAPLPGPTGGGVAVGGGSLYLVNEADDATRAAAWQFMTWLDEPAQQVTWSIGTGYIPTRLSAVEDPRLVELWSERPGYRVAFDQLAAAGPIAGGGGPVIGDFAGFREAIEQALEALYHGADPAAVAAEAGQQATEAIQAYNRRIGE